MINREKIEGLIFAAICTAYRVIKKKRKQQLYWYMWDIQRFHSRALTWVVRWDRVA